MEEDFMIVDYLSKKGQKVIEIPNVDRIDLTHAFNELGFKDGAEIGVERGLYSRELLVNNPGSHLFLVDPWKAYRGYREHVSQSKLDGFFTETQQRLEGHNYTIIRAFSTDAAQQFKDGSLDFVYIDGNHEYSHVVADICAWTPKVRKGGVVAGHDYIRRKNKDYLMHVIEAVGGYCSAYQIEPLFVLGRKAAPKGEKRDSTRSWLFVKQ